MKSFLYHSITGICFIFLFLVNILLIIAAFFADTGIPAVAALLLSVGQVILHDRFRRKSTVWRNLSAGYYIRHYAGFVFSKLPVRLNGRREPRFDLNRKERELILKRSANIATDIVTHMSFGRSNAFECLMHYSSPLPVDGHDLRVEIGGAGCQQPYRMSPLNIGSFYNSMPYIRQAYQLSEACKIGNFAINTGVQGISPSLIRGGGDLVWQVPFKGSQTGFSKEFDEISFARNSMRPYVKMIEVIICPRVCNPTLLNSGGKQYSCCSERDAELAEALHFARRLQLLCNGKPVGIKPLIQTDNDIYDICNALLRSGIFPDFLNLEIQTGPQQRNLSPIVNSTNINNLLALTKRLFSVYKIPSRLILSGRIIIEFDILRGIALGADAFFTAQPMLLPVRQPYSFTGNRIESSQRVANFHRNTIEATVKLMEYCRYRNLTDVSAADFYHSSPVYGIKTLEDLHFKLPLERSKERLLSPVLN